MDTWGKYRLEVASYGAIETMEAGDTIEAALRTACYCIEENTCFPKRLLDEFGNEIYDQEQLYEEMDKHWPK